MKKVFVYLSIGLVFSLSTLVSAERGKEGKDRTLTLKSSVTRQNYRLRSGDRIHVNVFEFPELSKDQIVLPDGTINVLYVGPLQASGKTSKELSNEITSSLSGQVRKPIVSIAVIGTSILKMRERFNPHAPARD
jgi:Polysaccharide biosynthesis/export protein